MSDFWWKLPVLRRFGALKKGAAEAVPLILGLSLIFAGVSSMASFRPAPETLEAAAQIGATLLVAFALEVSWVVRASRRRPLRERESRLGSFSAVGAAAAFGVLLSLALAERARGHHWTWLDNLGLGWVLASLFFLGLMIVMQPWITHEWMYEDQASD